MKTIYTLFIFLAFAGYCNAQHTPAWVKFGGPSDYANFDVTEVSVKTDIAGNIYTAASLIDTAANMDKILLVKYNPSGVQQWSQIFDSNDPDYHGSYATALLVDANGNSYVCGYGRSDGTTGLDLLVAKYDSAGTFLWSSYLDGGASENDYVTCATFDAAGNIIVGGRANGFSSTGDDMVAAKWEPSGAFDWLYTYNNTVSNDEDRTLAITSDLNNNIFITGSSYNTGTKRDVLTVKINSGGTEQWVKRYAYTGDSDNDFGNSVTTDATGNSYVAGTVGAKSIMLKYSPIGTQLLNVTYDGIENYALGGKIMLDPSGNIVVAGEEFVSTANQNDLMVLKYGQLGALVWATNFDTPSSNESSEKFFDAAMDASGNVYITGTYDGPVAKDMQTVIVSPGGNTIWNTAYTNTLNAAGTDRAYSITLDKNRNIIIAGISETTTGTADDLNVVTIKYDAPVLSGIRDIAIAEAHMSIYPNPTSGTLNVSVTNESLLDAAISITDITGQKITEEKLTSLTQQINLSQVAKGMYIVSIVNDKASVSRKLVVK